MKLTHSYGPVLSILLRFALLFSLGFTFAVGEALSVSGKDRDARFRTITEELETVKSSVVKIELLLKEITNTTNEITAPVKKSASPSNNKKKGLKKKTLKNSSETRETNPIKTTDESLYENILMLIKQSKYAEAEAEMLDFIKHFPKSNLLEDVYYFLGDLYLTENKYRTALLNFLKSYQGNKTGIYAPLAVVKSITALRSSGEYEDACLMLKKALKEFSAHSRIQPQLEKEKTLLSLHCRSEVQKSK